MQIDFENLLKQTIGLDPSTIGRATIERAVRARMAKIGLEEPEEYWRHLQSSKAEVQELVESVVIPETWFFRDPEAFAALVRIAVAKRRLEVTRTFRLLSIPCSTGEEPYSMVMALLDGGLSPEQIRVDAVDISARALKRARYGHYGTNSFRVQSLYFRDRYFEPSVDGYTLTQSVLDRVTFRQGNLFADDLQLDDAPYDVVFCRNLLIYFDRATQEQAMRRLGSFLVSDGLLFVGPAEAFVASCKGFAPVDDAMSFAFRRGPAKSPVQRELDLAAALRPPKIRGRTRVRCPVRAKYIPEAAPVASPADGDGLHIARGLADAGKLKEARDILNGHLQQQGVSAEVFYLLGLVRDAMGNRQDAENAYRKALYLEPDHINALMQLALLLETHGDNAVAGRLRERARRADRALQNGQPITRLSGSG